MTENEAQKWLERFEWDDSEETSEALTTICEALQEYPKFRAIGTVEEFKTLKKQNEDCIIKHLTNECSYNETGCSDCKGKETIRVAVERMKPKKPLLDKSENEEWRRCPSCKAHTIGKTKCCARCGQAFNWSE